LSEDYIKFTVNLPRDLHKRAKVKAAQQETTLADVVRECLDKFVGAPPEQVEEEQKKEASKA
jgi:predicted HicB family RNase H-like nuclease